MSNEEPVGVRRPASVTVVAALVWVNAALDLAAGVFFIVLALAGGDDPATTTTFAVMGTVSILLAVIAAALAFGLMRGNPVARTIVTAVEIVSIAASVSAAFINPAAAVNEIVGALIALAIVLMLWSSEATRFFRGLATTQPD
ncbi:hypothetical protein [Agromyces sp. ZXT2-6]|uniref:hypothetical protein n=1 Tax=Agromyces sp. ZXT2-6 TaxID=3461153 RepID=UPI0040552015